MDVDFPKHGTVMYCTNIGSDASRVPFMREWRQTGRSRAGGARPCGTRVSLWFSQTKNLGNVGTSPFFSMGKSTNSMAMFNIVDSVRNCPLFRQRRVGWDFSPEQGEIYPRLCIVCVCTYTRIAIWIRSSTDKYQSSLLEPNLGALWPQVDQFEWKTNGLGV